MDVSTEDEGQGDNKKETMDDNNKPAQPFAPPVEHPLEHAHSSPGPVNANKVKAPNKAPVPCQDHGYATIELHQGAAKVIRWEYLDNDNANTQPAPGGHLEAKGMV